MNKGSIVPKDFATHLKRIRNLAESRFRISKTSSDGTAGMQELLLERIIFYFSIYIFLWQDDHNMFLCEKSGIKLDKV